MGLCRRARRDLASVVRDLQKAVAREVKLPPGISIAYTGQFEYLERAIERLKIVVPATLLIIFVLLYADLPPPRRSGADDGDAAVRADRRRVAAVSARLQPVGRDGRRLHRAGGRLGRVRRGDADLPEARACRRGADRDRRRVDEAVREGALLRVRPKAMTVAVILAGLLPILIGHGTGSEVMSRIAAPMIGGMITAPLLSMLVIPAAYLLLQRRRQGRASIHPPIRKA